MTRSASYTARVSRRQALGLFGAAATVVGYGRVSLADTASADASCVLTPAEITGPYPLFDDVASASKYARSDLAEGRPGVPLELLLTLADVNDACSPVTDARVYVWHCDKDGLYSGYRQSGTSTVGMTFCRGLQATDAAGRVRFRTLYPGWYPGRVTHMHFRVYLGRSLQVTSQLTFPQEVTREVYRSALYAARGQNTTVDGFRDDGVFADGERYQVCTMRDNAASGGYDAALRIGIARSKLQQRSG